MVWKQVQMKMVKNASEWYDMGHSILQTSNNQD